MIVDPAVRRANLAENLPRLDRFSAAGERTEDLAHSADHHLAGRYIDGSGAMSVYAEPESNLLALALFYLSSYNGEAGHNCPLACTAGVIKTLRHAGGEELKKKYLPRLLNWASVVPRFTNLWKSLGCVRSAIPNLQSRTCRG